MSIFKRIFGDSDRRKEEIKSLSDIAKSVNTESRESVTEGLIKMSMTIMSGKDAELSHTVIVKAFEGTGIELNSGNLKIFAEGVMHALGHIAPLVQDSEDKRNKVFAAFYSEIGRLRAKESMERNMGELSGNAVK